MKTRTAKLYWTETDGRTGSEHLAIDSLHPFSRYGFHRPCLTNLDRTQSDAQKLAFRMRSIITFCDTLGVAYGPHPISLRRTPECFDHTAYWQTLDKRSLITTEPYRRGVEPTMDFCEQQGWPAHIFDRAIGLSHSAPAGTHFILISPDGIPIEPLVSALEAVMPVYQLHHLGPPSRARGAGLRGEE
ncbi:MAG: hypothetical protein ACLPWS_14790 [Rhodomicrobium sp.]